MPDLAIGVLYSARPWRSALQRYVRDHVAGVTLRLMRDSRMAMEEEVHLVVLDDETSFLTPAFVASLRERGVKVVGVYDPSEAGNEGPALLSRVGVDAVVPSTLPTEHLFARLAELAPEVGVDDQFHQLVASLDLAEVSTGGSVIAAVGGPPGAGATEVAVALADVTSRYAKTILIDVDEVNPGVARRLGLTLHPHLLTVLDGMRGVSLDGTVRSGDPFQSGLAQPAPGTQHAPPFDVIAGLANRKDWPLVRTEDVSALLELAATRWPAVVVNLGPHLEDMSRWVDRFGASRAAAALGDKIVGVCEASPRGLLRFFDWLAELAELAPGTRVTAVLNRAPRSKFGRAELVEQLWEHAGPSLGSVVVAASDATVERAAWDGVTVSRGRFLRAIEGVARDMIDVRAAPHAAPLVRGGGP